MMGKRFLAAALFVGAALLVAVPSQQVQAQQYVIFGDTTGGPLWQRPVGAGPVLSGNCTACSFQGIRFRLRQGGVTNIQTTLLTHTDTYLHLYQGAFDPANQLRNLIAGDDDGGVGLASRINMGLAGQTNYVVVTSGFDNTDFGTYLLAITAPGGIVLSDAEIATTWQNGRVMAGRNFASVIGERLMNRRNRAAQGRRFQASAPADERRADTGERRVQPASDGSTHSQMPPRDYGAGTVRTWIAGVGTNGEIDAEGFSGSSQANIDSAGVVMGVDFHLLENVILGAALGYQSTDYTLKALTASGDSDDYHFALYGNWAQGPYSVDAVLGYGYSDNSINRTIGRAGTTGSSNGHMFLFSAEGGYLIEGGGFDVKPFVRADVTTLFGGGYTEAASPGVIALSVSDRSFTAARTMLGVAVSRAFALGQVTSATISGRVAWAHEFGRDRVVNAQIAAMPTFTSRVEGTRPDSDLVVFRLGGELQTGLGVAIFANYFGEFGSRVSMHGGTVGLSYRW